MRANACDLQLATFGERARARGFGREASAVYVRYSLCKVHFLLGQPQSEGRGVAALGSLICVAAAESGKGVALAPPACCASTCIASPSSPPSPPSSRSCRRRGAPVSRPDPRKQGRGGHAYLEVVVVVVEQLGVAVRQQVLLLVLVFLLTVVVAGGGRRGFLLEVVHASLEPFADSLLRGVACGLRAQAARGAPVASAPGGPPARSE